jgi:hypothetical protein
MSSTKKIYVDSNVFLFPVLYEDKKAAAAKKILEDIVGERLSAVTSVLTWDEFCYVLQRTLGKEVANEEGQKFLRFPHLEFVACNLALLSKAHRIMDRADIRPRDAIHAATAIQMGAYTIASDDADFDHIDDRLVRMPVD